MTDDTHNKESDDVRTLRAANNLANAYLGQGQPDEARRLLEEVVEASRRVCGPESPDTLGSMNNLATVLARLRHWDEARALHDAGTALGIALTGAVNLLDPETVVLGGALAGLAPWLLPSLETELAGRTTGPACPVTGSQSRTVPW